MHLINEIMSSQIQPLAIRYRPMLFQDLVGQEVVAQVIQNGIRLGRIPNGYLFTGTRGIGKTTTARLIAKALNCTQLTDNCEPCNTCGNCQAIINDNHPDVLELDAASRTGISDIREIIDNLPYRPIQGRFRVFIIDEVHMLSNSAFNALLKTLEEPPAHVKFIFATTELHKIPATIISRCQRFDLKNLTDANLVEHLKNILSKEERTINAEILELIVTASGGSARDALSLLDQMLNYSATKGEISVEEARSILGRPDSSQIVELLHLVMQGNLSSALALADDLYYNNFDAHSMLVQLQGLVHYLMCSKIDGKKNFSSYPEAARNTLRILVEKLDIVHLTRIWQILLKGNQEIRQAYNPNHALNMILVRMNYCQHLPQLSQLIDQDPSAAAPIKPDTPSASASVSPTSATQLSSPKGEANSASPSALDEAGWEKYQSLLETIKQNGELLLYNQLRSEVKLIGISNNIIAANVPAYLGTDFTKKWQQLLNTYTGAKWVINSVTEEGRTLLEYLQEVKERKLNAAKSRANVQEVLQHFPNAAIIDIEPVNL